MQTTAEMDAEIASLEQRVRNGRAMASQCLFEARECAARATKLRSIRARERRIDVTSK